MEGTPTIGYHKIRGLGAPLRMMCYYKKQSFRNRAYAQDFQESWFKEEKPKLLEKNALANLPYVVDGETVVTQSNTCLLYLGQKLSIDKPEHFIRNHGVLDQVMDLRNDLMRVVYPFGDAKTKEEFPEVGKKHAGGSAKTNFNKLEAFCGSGPYMCGDVPQSGDFHVFEMVDQHIGLFEKLGVADDDNVLKKCPKLMALHAKMKSEPTLQAYFAHDMYLKYSQNNAFKPKEDAPPFTHFTGVGDDLEYFPSLDEVITF